MSAPGDAPGPTGSSAAGSHETVGGLDAAGSSGPARHDPLLFHGTAEHYVVGRPPYSAELRATVDRELGLDGSGRLLDVGCGPGTLALELSPSFAEVVGLDPDPGMIRVAGERAAQLGVTTATWVLGVAEDLTALDLGPFRVVTFGQSIHWTDRDPVLDAVFDLLEPGGSVILLANTVEGRPRPPGPGLPLIPHDEVKGLVMSYLGPERRAGSGFSVLPTERFEDSLVRSRFGGSRTVFAPGRPDVVRDVDGVMAGFLSMSWSAPHLYGRDLDAFRTELRALLAARSPTGRFWDWPGDTELVIATKP